MNNSQKEKVAVFAPHLTFPIRNGADKYISEKWVSLHKTHDVTLYTADAIYTATQNHEWRKVRSFERTSSLLDIGYRWLGFMKFVLGQKEFLYYKFFVNPKIGKVEREFFSKSYDIVVASFIPTYWRHLEKAISSNTRLIVETHNFDPKIYFDRAREAKGIRRKLYALAAKRSASSLRRLPPGLFLSTLGEEDAKLFRASTACIVHAGTLGFREGRQRTAFPDASGPVTLSFVGSLGLQMNAVAICRFVETHWPSVRERWPNSLLKIIGSNPCKEVISLQNKRNGVEIHGNPTDEELLTLISSSHATVLPFFEANGLKLKATTSIEAGVPLISSLEMPAPLVDGGAAFLANSTEEWISAISILIQEEAQHIATRTCASFCQRHSWADTATLTVERLHGH